MIANGKKMRPIMLSQDKNFVKIIDQRLLPHKFVIVDLKDEDDIIKSIKEMYVRGAPLIGATAGLGVYLACKNYYEKITDDEYLKNLCQKIKNARPTAINLTWAVDRVLSEILKESSSEKRIDAALNKALEIIELEAENCRKIGEHGFLLIEKISREKSGKTVNILTHCNAGWLACIEYGTATAPIYVAREKEIDVHVWVDETRPLNQGARLTAWELGKAGIKHTVITDNAGGHLMQHGMVDMVITGTDRTTKAGDVANKIGTYLKALAAKDNGVPFYVALPSTTFDWNLRDGIEEIPIEERDSDEIKYVRGMENGKIRSVLITPDFSPAGNWAFDVTPARLVTGFITERGICNANEDDILRLFPEFK